MLRATGKPFTITNVVEKMRKAAIVLSHNKGLAGQFYAELIELFQNNHFEYFV